MQNQMPDFSKRSYQSEWMDDLEASGEIIVQTLKELDTINRLLGGNALSINGLRKILAKNPGRKNTTITIADIGCGGGDIMKLMADWGRKNKVSLKFVGIDANLNILDYARENTKAYPEISYQQIDIFSEEFAELSFDIIHTSLFTHHFTDSELVGFYSQWKSQAKLGIINNDLHRHWFAYHSIHWLTTLFSRSPMVQNDARLSVLRSFSKAEWQQILAEAKITRFDIQWRWAFRWELVVYL
jgi:2-polyprenyl-3-methyl-5-hydroxy-6-metoxy-1,4-benzoquinol methylase